jgi:hypothetical protein
MARQLIIGTHASGVLRQTFESTGGGVRTDVSDNAPFF